ncbi:MAG: hypothetical protein QW521_04710 [Desulfurococcaceae archaeon]
MKASCPDTATHALMLHSKPFIFSENRDRSIICGASKEVPAPDKTVSLHGCIVVDVVVGVIVRFLLVALS